MSNSSNQAVAKNGSENIEPEEVSIPVPWGHISGKWWGPKDIQPILSIHGWQDNAGTFDNIANKLNNNKISLLCIDLPGHGLSSHIPDGTFYYVCWDGIIILRRIVKYYKWDKIKILGHSLGGAIGFLYAATYPDEIDLLISLDIASPSVKKIPNLVTSTGNQIDKYLKYEKLTLDNVPCYEYDEMLGIVLDAYNGNITRKSAEILMIRGMQPASLPGKYYFSRDPRLKVSMLGFLTADLSKQYAEQIKCPYLNIRALQGLKNEISGHYEEILDIIKKKSSKFEYQEVEGTHHVHLNDPEKVAPLIENFLNSI
ncbi:probable serine hydrolase isoform X2 [Aphidius gifuensis]|uniref:probable serine hydrolase isoform X2 n=1 Tax=Aphidius gifuensis TaxID=684658 RepID=UPI001CDB5103|nr:probable serine hydrolase isoform X2 [Aphidius gifuensis]XP_044015512.1 probable serine hydrolase isoform X2 [Aphidius gifuensis]